MASKFLSASKFQVTIDQAALLASISTGPNGNITGRNIRSYVLPRIEEAQDKLIKDFYRHSITKEIKAGPTASNSSGTLNGYGNLFSFIGFARGDNPLQVVEEILNKNLTVKVRAAGGGKFKISITNAPSQSEIYNSTPLPWASGSSWTEGVERGISNLGSFMYKKQGIRGSSKGSRSRSGTGIQLDRGLRSATFRTQPYISKLIESFYKNLTKKIEK